MNAADQPPGPADPRGEQLNVRVNDRVRLTNDPTRHGIVRRSQRDAHGESHLVFLSDGTEQWFAADDLEFVPEESPIRLIDREAFLRRLALTKLSSRFSDIFYAYRASRTNFEVYQFKPVLKFIGMDTPGLLIADEVGLGKTIEAAIIYLEMKARADVQRVLVVCPAGLTRKWQSEFLLRFDEDFAILDRQHLRLWINNYAATEGHLPLRAIVSLEAVRDTDIREMLATAGVTLDLVIFDEAHHLRNRPTKSFQIAESLINLATRVLLLTATPLQTREQDLFNLLQLIAPGDFPNYDEFEAQLQPNALLNRAIHLLGEMPPDGAGALAALELVPGMPYSDGIRRNPVFTQAVERLGAAPLTEPREIVSMRRELQLLNTIGHVYTRTKKRDVTGVAKRVATTIEVQLTDAEAEFYAAVIEWVRARARASSGWNVILGFELINRERQAASSMSAAREYLEDLLATRSSHLDLETTEPVVDEGGAGLSESPDMVAAVQRLLEAAKAIRGVDSKYEQFRLALARALASDPQGKLIVFSFFKKTLRYLKERLTADGLGPLSITGDDKPEIRARRVEEFRDDPTRHVLLSSEVGAEGLDFQFAYTIFNYDLPWNPMRVEQRIGRIDRYGQERDKIFIVNFVLKDTIESRILARLYDRINVFEEAVGDLEPIIGEVIDFLTRELFDHRLTPEEERELAHQVDLRITAKEQDLKEFESRRAELMGDDRLFEREVANRVTSGRFVSPDELIALIQPWLRADFPKTQLYDNEGDTSWHMRGDPELGAALRLGTYGTGGHDAEGRSFVQRMQMGVTVPLTFDPPLASGRPKLELIHPRHPLTLAAVEYWKGKAAAAASDDLVQLRIASSDVPAGEYDFFLFRLEVSAASPSVTFETVALHPDGSPADEVADVVLRLLVEATGYDDSHIREASFREQRLTAEKLATEIRSQRQIEAETRNAALISLRQEAIIRSEDAKIRRAGDFLATVTDSRIVTMKMREIENIQASRRRRLAELEDKRKVVVSIQEVAAGRIVVHGIVSPAKRDVPSASVVSPVAQPTALAQVPVLTTTTPDATASATKDEVDSSNAAGPLAPASLDSEPAFGGGVTPSQVAATRPATDLPATADEAPPVSEVRVAIGGRRSWADRLGRLFGRR
jgi:ATP-dependent helicase HepA